MKEFNSLIINLLGVLALIVSFFSCKHVQEKKETNSLQVAFLSDVHLLDIYGEFSDNSYRGILNPTTQKYTLARTMQSQLESTRLFNENYFAFKAALNDVVKRGVKYVALPGDFSDDGQLVNIRGLKNILKEYSEKYHINFILTTGNHDPVRPFYQDAGKKDFLGQGGKTQAIFSKEGLYPSNEENALPTIITKDIARLGYQGILNELKDFGFYPKQNTIYWESPFTTYTYQDYTYDKALKYSDIRFRTYKIQPTNAEVPDLSYVTELGDDLWFLAIDANVYVPKGEETSYNPANFEGASTGYNNVLTHKDYLLTWIKSVTERAEKLGKKLIVFSHFPTIDFNDDATEDMKVLFGKDKMQMQRVPNEEVAKALAEAGVKVHFGGHMHINDTGLRKFKNGNGLINIQIPSLAAYIPGYKLLTIKNNNVFEIETVVLDNVADFKTLFPLYQLEHDYLEKTNQPYIWDAAILNANNYKEFTAWHLKELVRLRFLKNDWPKEFKDLLVNTTGQDLINIAKENNGDIKAFETKLKDQKISMEVFKEWTGLDMIHDFYKFKSADKLAVMDVGQAKLNQYILICELLKSSNHRNLKLWGNIFLKFCNGQPANHFKIDIQSSTITPIRPLY
ncbi:metallophosphoesterase [Wenyingzhuangia marina]|uniref:Calcineurin-like phosphoesterase n=1 Tax=Wenyingzhuangia marina TaxID=1195760 RepID=A0A1M5UFQ9_9FLAO|nr:metallophosphoesterase [Wenyingzhuangia marina]GGF67918.1 metallophosphoesterase [Wenyingzhuangia marina]SHH61787.1 Calcineurin-like phosphoesterase [Wenyingzhuangia marina]